ncbi:MAG: hypothetical protein ACE5H1_01975 [Thermodesulfobacteriota bacterium]
METIKIAEQINYKISQLDNAKKALKSISEEKAVALAEYEKQLAKVVIQLKNGVEFDIDGESISNPPTTILEKIAKGICWQKSLNKDKTESAYKNLIKGIDILESQLNGYQSINRYQSET